MKELVFATNNTHKLEEVRAILKPRFHVISLSDIGCIEDIDETADSLEGNALLKARYIYERYGVNCFADDTGLEVDALGSEPGVYSARYAGPQRNSVDNMHKVLELLKGNRNRRARFRTVIALIQNGSEEVFEGIINGIITESPAGLSGFGYDPIFIPDGYSETFAQLSGEAKNEISHRAIAVRKLACFLNK